MEKAKDAADETHSVEEMQKVFLFAAKNQVNVFVSTHRQVTLWGPNGEINDYSAREWSKLTGEYYYGRWDLYFNMLFDHLDRNETLNMDEYHEIHHELPTKVIEANQHEFFDRAAMKFISLLALRMNP